MTDLHVPGASSRLHTCISRKIYHLFSFDGIGTPDSADNVSSSEDEEMPLVGLHGIIRNQEPSQGSSSRNANPPGPHHLSTTTTSAPLQRTLSLSTITFPPTIWQAPWIASPFRRYASVFASDSVAQNIYEAASRDTIAEELDIRSTDVNMVAAMFKTLLGDAVEKEDFTDILSPNRTFLM